MSSLIQGVVADTLEGRNWVTKCLHPADPVTDIRGIPDESSSPTVLMGYNSIHRIAPAAGATGSWDFDMTITPDAIHHACVTVVDSIGSRNGSLFNTSLKVAGNLNPTYAQLFTAFWQQGIEAFRIAYFSATVYQDGPALANQGTMVASQWEVHPYRFTVTDAFDTDPAAVTVPVVQYQGTDLAYYPNMQTMPNAYFGESKFGCYMPLRLTRASHKWTTMADIVKHAPAAGGWGNISATDPFVGMTKTRAGASVQAHPPYPGVYSAWLSNAAAGVYGDPIFMPQNDIWGGVSVRGASTSSTYAIYFRVGIECRVQPGTILAPQLKMSPAFDPRAIESYFRINRELKDAYPSDYNDLGKILEVIQQAAKKLSPILQALHPGAGLASRLLDVGLSAASRTVKKREKKTLGGRMSSMSASQIEAAGAQAGATPSAALAQEGKAKSTGKRNRRQRGRKRGG